VVILRYNAPVNLLAAAWDPDSPPAAWRWGRCGRNSSPEMPLDAPEIVRRCSHGAQQVGATQIQDIGVPSTAVQRLERLLVVVSSLASGCSPAMPLAGQCVMIGTLAALCSPSRARCVETAHLERAVSTRWLPVTDQLPTGWK
jgi:hypothetical protein